jgi:hypothetical protein
MSFTEVKRQLRLSHWTSIIQECQSSGQSITSWCEEHDVKPYTYYYWLRIIRQKSLDCIQNEPSLLRIPDSSLLMKDEACGLHGMICIRHLQTSIELPRDYDVHRLAILIKELCE